MIEMNGARVGLLTTAGHRDEIELRRCFKEDIWDPAYPPPPPIVRRRARIGIDERLGADGTVVRELPEEQVREAARRLRLLGVESVAVAFLFSYLNPAHERRAREILLEEMPELA
jgi:N-methylhydantoinase A